jgi:hypothetical protein
VVALAGSFGKHLTGAALSSAKFGGQALALVFFEVPVPIVTFRVGAKVLALLERVLDFANAQCASPFGCADRTFDGEFK